MTHEQIINELILRNITLGSVESFTGGLFAAHVVNYPGVSKIFKGAIVSYQNEIKRRLVNIKQSDLDKYGAVSSVVAQAMARNGQKILGVDFCFAFTGNADNNSGEAEAGDVYIALIYGDVEILEHLHFPGDRSKVREAAVDYAFNMLERVLKNNI